MTLRVWHLALLAGLLVAVFGWFLMRGDGPNAGTSFERQDGPFTDLARGYNQAWNRDGTIVFARSGGVWQTAADGSDRQRLLDVDADAVGLLLSPDKRRMLVMDGGGNHVANVDGSNLRRVATPGATSTANWSDDGTELTYQAAEALWAIPVQGGNPRRLFDIGGRILALAPDGRMIVRAFAVRAHGSLRQTFLVDANGSARLLLPDGYMLDDARFRPDGRVEGIEEQGTFVVIDPISRAVQRPLQPHRVRDLPSSTADGRVVYAADDGVWVSRPDGTKRTRLTREQCHRPLVSPDSTLVLCGRFVPTGRIDDEGGVVKERRVSVMQLDAR